MAASTHPLTTPPPPLGQGGHDAAAHGLAEELATLAANLSPEAERSTTRAAVYLVARALLTASGEGHTALWLDRQDPLSDRPTEPLSGPCLSSALRSLSADEATIASTLAWCHGPASQPWLGEPDRSGTPFIVDRPGSAAEPGLLYLQRLWWQESLLAARLRALIARPSVAVAPALLRTALARSLASSPRALSTEQQDAIVAAATHPVTVIAGGPGSGKTSIVVALLRLLLELGVEPRDIALAAPTGKAAYRMAETLRGAPATGGAPSKGWPEAQTLHRLLDYVDASGGGAFGHHELRPLPHRVVIVDEGSMVDLSLMFHLVRALRPEAQLVLVGDGDQLPSVDPGAVFRQLTQSAPTVVRLGRSFRIDTDDAGGRAVSEWTAELRQATARPSGSRWLAPRTGADEVAFSGVELLDPGGGGRERLRLLDRWARERLGAPGELERWCQHIYSLAPSGEAGRLEHPWLRALLRHHEQRRVLCATGRDDRSVREPARGRALGVEPVNGLLRRHFRERVGSREPTLNGELPIAGEPVMVQQNLYRLGLFNGDQGVLVRVARGHDTAPSEGAPGGARGDWQWMVVFRGHDDELRGYPLASLRHVVSSSLATTVHKAQGAEHDEVLVLLPEGDLPLASRQWLYTAATRSRRAVVLVGSPIQLDRIFERRLVRVSRLAERLTDSSG
jgi:exodeoxyribonuclease V alpha subunit